MLAAWNLYLLFGFMAITNEQYTLGKWNLIWKQIIKVSKNPVRNTDYRSNVINMATVRVFEVLSHKFDVFEIEYVIKK